MKNNSEIVTDFNEDEAHDFTMIISHDLIPKLIKFADDYNFERDSIIKYTADLLTAMSEISTFENFKSEDAESEGKDEKRERPIVF